MAAGAARRRRSHHDSPRWAEKFPDTPEGLDAMHVEGEVRRHLRHGTDPDEIDDPDVRDAFLQRLQEEAAADDDATPRRRHLRAVTDDDPVEEPAAGPSRSRRAYAGGLRASGGLDASIGSAVLGVVAYALLVNYVRGGTPQVRKWVSAKFTNGRGRLS